MQKSRLERGGGREGSSGPGREGPRGEAGPGRREREASAELPRERSGAGRKGGSKGERGPRVGEGTHVAFQLLLRRGLSEPARADHLPAAHGCAAARRGAPSASCSFSSSGSGYGSGARAGPADGAAIGGGGSTAPGPASQGCGARGGTGRGVCELCLSVCLSLSHNSPPERSGAASGLKREGLPCRLLLLLLAAAESHRHRERRQGQPPPRRNFGVPGQDPGFSHRPAPVAPPPRCRDPPAGQGRRGLRSLPSPRRAQRRPPRLPGSLLPLLPPPPAPGGGDRQHSCLPFLAFPSAGSGGAGVWPRGWGRGRGLGPLPAGQ